ncbi:MAG: hypothetical protein IAA31_05925 [Candidatus Anaerobiospirillum merdipullorum]|uniref:Peptidase S24/S26A/S26B/S26C domain-containing protein n=1 Tax=Candidatus Anaerobiospirillum merdipullorum TaxID=2838450 RepID=A0A9E2KP36_9GAMM|nr:hypothetical protein [Candidatus Anaerobiospirillum merdipullorum]
MLQAEDALELLADPTMVQADFDLNSLIGLNYPGAFIFRMRSNSGQLLGILPGDFVVVRRDLLPYPQALIIVYLNERYQLLEVSSAQQAKLAHGQIFGVVCAVFRKSGHKAKAEDKNSA